jgi:hypothetical protein
MKEQYSKLISELQKCKYKSTDKVVVHLCADQIIIQTHKDSSERFDNLLYTTSVKVQGLVWGKNISACADFSGYEFIDSTRIK